MTRSTYFGSMARLKRLPKPARARTRPGFDFTHNMRRVIDDMVMRLPELAHIDMSQVAIAFCQTRKRVSHGLQASLTPMRFEKGATTSEHLGRMYRVQPLLDDNGREMLYILSFYLPRFLETDLREKLITILHELWHIGPDFDGDLRRHQGRCYIHSHSQAEYDEEMGRMADRWLAMDPPEEKFHFLRYSFGELYQLHGGMHGVKIPQPKLIPVK